jgi:hypothetical protein
LQEAGKIDGNADVDSGRVVGHVGVVPWGLGAGKKSISMKTGEEDGFGIMSDVDSCSGFQDELVAQQVRY